MIDTHAITVEGEQPYLVHVGRGIASEAVAALSAEARRVAILHAPALRELSTSLASACDERGINPLLIELPDAEAAKTADVAAACWQQLGEAGFTRSDAVIGVGGGATTDLSGFVAATWLRGVAHVAVPTTLLGMVDAAVGGKTGINTAEGKNLVGAFHPPAAVVCDLNLLAQLPRADYAAGLAEVVKCGFIRDPRILDLIELDPAAAATAGNGHESELIVRAISVKADVVSADLRESTTVSTVVEGRLPRVSSREVLNYGHTFGHAIEQVENFRWRHGDAISVGMVFVAELAHACGVLTPDLVQRHREILRSLALPVTYAGASWDDLVTAMSRDKKTRGSLLRFVVLEGLAEPVLLAGPSGDALAHAFARVSDSL